MRRLRDWVRRRAWRLSTLVWLARELWGKQGVFIEITTVKANRLFHTYRWDRFHVRDIIHSHQQVQSLFVRELEGRPAPTEGAQKG